MALASIKLTEQEAQALHQLQQQTGKTQEELLHEAVTRLLTQPQTTEERLALLQQARGLWENRADVPDVRALRAELDRSAL
jgi:hypothetical protein